MKPLDTYSAVTLKSISGGWMGKTQVLATGGVESTRIGKKAKRSTLQDIDWDALKADAKANTEAVTHLWARAAMATVAIAVKQRDSNKGTNVDNF